MVLEKLNNTKVIIGYLDELLDDRKLDDYHENLVVDPRSYFVTKVLLSKFLGTKKNDQVYRWTVEYSGLTSDSSGNYMIINTIGWCYFSKNYHFILVAPSTCFMGPVLERFVIVARACYKDIFYIYA